MKIKIKQELKPLTRTALERATHAVLLLPEGNLPDVPYADYLQRRLKQLRSPDGARLVCDLPNPAATHVSATRLKASISTFELLTLARHLVSPLLEQNASEILIACLGVDAQRADRAIEAIVAALLAGAHAMPSYKVKAPRKHPLRSILVHHPRKLDWSRTLAEADGNNLARTLTALPPNELTPAQYRERVAPLIKTYGWDAEFWDVKTLKKKNAGAFLAVAQGSPEPDAGMLHLRYTPKRRKSQATLALVGKGVCFDTGGMNLKAARHMHGMHEDMAGSAVALGTLVAFTELNVDFAVDCWLALVQNHIGPHAYKQNDVVRAANGMSIEVVHTDAEGRMILADTLYFASRAKPTLLIDYATLTGSCIAALGTNYSGVFANRDTLAAHAIQAGKDSGERVWPFPTDADYDASLDSTIADIKQCTLENEADHILATRFLSRFVASDVPWMHVDLSAINHKGGLAHIPTDVTGFGVRMTLNLILDQMSALRSIKL